MLNADEAIKKWGASKLKGWRDAEIDPDTVEVELTTWNTGYCETCWNETTGILITGKDILGKSVSYEIAEYEFNFAEIIAEVLEAGQSA